MTSSVEFSLDRDGVAELLEDMADLLEIAGENPFKLRAYRDGAERLRERTEEEFRTRVEEASLQELEGIGQALSDKIQQAVNSGTIEKYDETRQQFPVTLLDILEIQGIGPKSVRKMYDEMGIESITDLESALTTEQLAELDGFGPKTIENIRHALERMKKFNERTLLMNALPIARELRSHLNQTLQPERLEWAGSFRRGRETVGDLDILVAGVEEGAAGDVLVDYPGVTEVLVHGDTKTSVITDAGLQVDLREVEPESFGAALIYFTGSKQHNVHLRGLARDRGWTINEYGLIDEETGERLAGESEKSIYQALDLNWIPPELREDHGEFERARDDDFTELIDMDDLQGDCHIHTTASDGRGTLREMVEAARDYGRKYIVITDHSRSLRVASGLSTEELREQNQQIKQLNDEFDGIEVWSGTEADILEDGSMDYDDDLLASLDFVIASIHSRFQLPREQQTERVVKALRHPEVNVLAHPSGRKLGQRDPYELDMDRVLSVAAEQDVLIEINANGLRLDANDRWCRHGRQHGNQFIINSDAHAVDHLEFLDLGVLTARRGGLNRSDIANTRPPETFFRDFIS